MRHSVDLTSLSAAWSLRSVSASYVESKDLQGIEVYRFTLLLSTLASPKENPDNQCYCSDMEVTRNCTMAGVLDIGPCQEGQTLFFFFFRRCGFGLSPFCLFVQRMSELSDRSR